jgi:FKBP-type peptidyl-prolyl cis-trans isomerase 2
MRTVQAGDRVKVHYVKRFQDGSVASSRSRGGIPVELTVGTDHPRLPGLGLGLVGLLPGNHVTLNVPAGPAPAGAEGPGRLRRLARTRFAEHAALPPGKWVRLLDRRGRRRIVRVVEADDRVVLVDTTDPRAGQALELEVEVVGLLSPDAAGAQAP